MGRSSPEAIRLRKLLDKLDGAIENLRRPNRIPPDTVALLIKEMDCVLDDFDRSNLDETMQRRLLKKTDWYKQAVALARKRNRI